MEDGAREALIAYLEKHGSAPPARVDSAAPRPGTGEIRTTLEEGEVFLAHDSRGLFRLSWKASDQDRRRFLPEGEYTLRGYRIQRRDEKGDGWHLSVSTPGYRTVPVSASRPLELTIDPGITVRCRFSRARRDRNSWTFSAHLSGGKGKDLAVYRGGERVPLELRLVDDAKFQATVDRVAALQPAVLVGCHTPVVRGADMVAAAIEQTRLAPTATFDPEPDQAVLETIQHALVEAAVAA